jgi:hypothetical protein
VRDLESRSRKGKIRNITLGGESILTLELLCLNYICDRL